MSRFPFGNAALAAMIGLGGLVASVPAFADGVYRGAEGGVPIYPDQRRDRDRDHRHYEDHRPRGDRDRHDDRWRHDREARPYYDHDRAPYYGRPYGYYGRPYGMEVYRVPARFCSPRDAIFKAERMQIRGIRLSGRGNAYYLAGWRYGHPVRLVIGKQPGCPVYY